MHKSFKAQRHDQSESGLVSILVTIIIMIVLSLIVLGFAKLVRRQQRAVLDRQLSTQAFYAAEAGVNDGAKAIRDAVTTGTLIAAKTTCDPNAAIPSNDVNTTTGTKYTCLLINPTPTNLVYSGVSDKPKIITLDTVSLINRIHISWQNEGQLASPTYPSPLPPHSQQAFPQKSTWLSTTPAVLRVTLTPIEQPSDLSRLGLIQNTFVAFLYPFRGVGSGSVLYANSTGAQGGLVGGKCSPLPSDPTKCSPAFNVDVNLPGSFPRKKFLITVESIYNISTVTVSAFGATGPALPLANAQAIIDSTGKSQDVLRRIQVRMPLNNSYNNGEPAIDSADSICKRLQVTPSTVTVDNPFSDSACNLN